MKGKVFLIHWDPEQAERMAAPLRQAGWEVATEAEDGARAARQILKSVPDAAVISLSQLPNHGVSAAYYLRGVRQTRHLPIVFVDGPTEVRARAKSRIPDALFTEPSDLGKILSPLSG